MFRAELLKLSTIRSTQIAAFIGIVGIALTQGLMFWFVPALTLGLIDVPADIGLPAFDTGSHAFQIAALNLVSGGSGSGSLSLALIAIVSIGVLAATTDYRFGGMATAALAQPRRVNILAGKVAATALIVAIIGVVYALVSVGVLWLATQTAQEALVISGGDILSAAARSIAALALLSLAALAVGLLVRSTLAAFLVVIGVVTIEPIIQGIGMMTGSAAGWMQWLPLALAQTAAGDFAAAPGPNPLTALGMLAAGTLVLLVIAGAVLRRRDL
ncbi:hypothetical protein JOF28_001841 [Leucobacter exalbidus]|uniref:ABC-2 family transporter protein n=1 Tax=Leucobacter exalbidus TaxID=662960 RepID=A0A940T497_9MICO|nr:hypothetical protein [Leucobacter exalbidus]MBP1326609.1 hypothetical protein [Leucobacter exalbidus]